MDKVAQAFKVGVVEGLVIMTMFYTPKFLWRHNPFVKIQGGTFREMFDLFEEEYNEHLKEYDEGHMRDFIDVYIRERKRAEREGDSGEGTGSNTLSWNHIRIS